MTTVDRHPPGIPSWFDLMTPDIEKARAFYHGVFGWDYEVGSPESGNYSMAKVDGKHAAGLGALPPGAPSPTAWTVYFNVDDADATAETIKANGGAIMMGPMDVFDQGRLVVAVDPTGGAFGLWQPGRHIGAGIRNVTGTMGWQECHTRDAATARDFYAKTFQLEPVKVEGMEYWTLNRGPEAHGGVYQDPRMPEGVPTHWLVYFCVDDADAAAAKVTAGGGKVVMAPQTTPHGRMAVVADPFGAVFAVIKPPEA